MCTNSTENWRPGLSLAWTALFWGDPSWVNIASKVVDHLFIPLDLIFKSHRVSPACKQTCWGKKTDLRPSHLEISCNMQAGIMVVLINVCFPSAEPPYSHLIDTLKDGRIKFFNPQKLNDPRYGEFRPSTKRTGTEFKHICPSFETFCRLYLFHSDLHDVEVVGRCAVEIYQHVVLYTG